MATATKTRKTTKIVQPKDQETVQEPTQDTPVTPAAETTNTEAEQAITDAALAQQAASLEQQQETPASPPSVAASVLAKVTAEAPARGRTNGTPKKTNEDGTPVIDRYSNPALWHAPSNQLQYLAGAQPITDETAAQLAEALRTDKRNYVKYHTAFKKLEGGKDHPDAQALQVVFNEFHAAYKEACKAAGVKPGGF